MLEWIVSSSVLIAIVILLRAVLKRKISLRLQYALWALVLVRLLLPFSIGSSSISVMNQVEHFPAYRETAEPEVHVPEHIAPQPGVSGNTDLTVPGGEMPPVVLPEVVPPVGSTGNSEQTEQNTPGITVMPPVQGDALVQETPPEVEIPAVQSEETFDIVSVLRTVWIGGSVLLGAWFVVTNLSFAARLRKNRTRMEWKGRLPVYLCDAVDTPCLFGFFRPAVYLTEEVVADERTMRHAVEHELTHYRHKDNIWAVLRCVCLAVHWYNPFVWCAAILSRNDAELSCDESTIRRLGESERAEYGRTLLRLTCEKRAAIMTTATTMTGSGRSIRERIALIVKKPKMAVYTLIAVVVIIAVAMICTFTGAKDHPENNNDGADNITEDGGDSENNDDGEDSESSGDTENNDEPEIPEDLAQVLHRLETLTAEDIVSFGYMQADLDILIPLINTAAGTYTPSADTISHGEWSIQLNLTEIRDDPGHNPEVLCLTIGPTVGIIHVHYRVDTLVDPYDTYDFYLNSIELWDYIFSLYNIDGVDQAALSLYKGVLGERARVRIAEHAVNLVPEGFPALTGFEVASLRLEDSFFYEEYYYRIYSYDIAYLTDDPDPGRYGWPQDAYADEQGRIRWYDPCRYLVVAYAHDEPAGFEFFSHSIAYDLPLYFRMDIIESFTGQKLYLDWESDAYRQHIYINDGVSIEIHSNFGDLVEVHRDPDTWCHGVIMNPTYYSDLPDETLFALYHACEYWENGGGLIFSIRRYTEEEYQTLYLNSYSRQQVFARDDNYYYCVFLPTGESTEDSETTAIIEELLNQQLETITAMMIEFNYWLPHSDRSMRIQDVSIVPEEFSEIIWKRAKTTLLRHNNEHEERGLPSFTGYKVLSFGLEDSFSRDGAEYEIYHWDIVFYTDDPNAEQYQWGGSPFVDDQYRVHYYDQHTYFVVYRSSDLVKWDFFHYDLYSEEKKQVFDLLEAHFTAEVETLPALPLSESETDVICDAVMQDLKRGWWNGLPLTDCTYEAGAFQCVYREIFDYTERLYGYAGYFRFDENGSSVEHWYSATIITLSVETGEVINIWWPGDGASYERDVLGYFPEEIRDIVAEPNAERYQAVLAQLEAIAQTQMVPMTPSDTEIRLSTLTAEDIKYVEGYISTLSAQEIAETLRAAVVNMVEPRAIDYNERLWMLTVYLSDGEHGSSTLADEHVALYAGLEENIVEVWHTMPYGTAVVLYIEDAELYWMIRGSYQTEEYVDEEAFARFGDILCARAQETVDRSRENADEFSPMPYTGYEIISLKAVETFEKDDAVYEVYEWNVAFLHDDPTKVGWAGGMWLDSELRVRDCESDIYFVLCTSGDTVDHGFFHWELYLGPDEETGRENAHAEIIARFAREG